MYQWDKTIKAIHVEAGRVIHLFRSMREVQLALPGVSAQEASSYLCQYHSAEGIVTIAAFHLHKSQLLAFYCSDPRVVPEQKADSMLDQGLNFVESMGFLMTDQDLHLLNKADQDLLWASLPIAVGLTEGGESAVPNRIPDEMPVQAAGAAPQPVVAPPVAKAVSSAKIDPPVEVADNVDDLLDAVEAMRAKRPGLRARKAPPTMEEQLRRRLQLRETVGRILASL